MASKQVLSERAFFITELAMDDRLIPPTIPSFISDSDEEQQSPLSLSLSSPLRNLSSSTISEGINRLDNNNNINYEQLLPESEPSLLQDYLPLTSVSGSSTSSSLTSDSSTIAGDDLNPPSQQSIVHSSRQLSLEVRAQIHALHHIASWPYRKIAESVNLPLTTVYRAAKQPLHQQTNSQDPTRGRNHVLSSTDRQNLIQHATSSAENRCKPLTEISYLAGVHACEKTLRQAFAQAGYHRRVARKNPFLKPDHILVCSYFFLLYSFKVSTTIHYYD